MTKLRMGIMGCSRQSLLAVVRATRSSADVEVASVASQSPARAREFAAKHGIRAAADSYQSLIDDDGIDAVYIGLPNNCHTNWSLAAMRAGRHVLAEKPLCMSLAEAEAIAETAERTGRACWEAITTAAHPWQREIRRMADRGRYGRVVSITVNLSFDIDGDRLSRLRPRKDGGGVFLDTAPYWLQIVESVSGLDVRARTLELTEALPGLDVAATAELVLLDGISARLRASYLDAYLASVSVRFEQAHFRLPDLFRANVGTCKLHGEWADSRSGQVQRVSYGPLNAFEVQLSRFAELTRGPNPWAPTKNCVARRKLMDELLMTYAEGA